VNAILLSAGFGVRLKPLTNSIPKCLVPIQGQPLLEIWLQSLKRSGIKRILINTHYLPEKVSEFVEKSEFNKEITLIHENILLGTAGTLINNIDFFDDEDGMLIHADNYSLEDFNAFIKSHNERPDKCLISMITFRTDTPSTCGIVELNDQAIVVGFHEKIKKPPGNLANGAVYIISREALKIIRKKYKDATDFSLDILPKFIGKIYSFETKKTFIDIGSILNYEKANNIKNS